jgi:hypothetical protein
MVQSPPPINLLTNLRHRIPTLFRTLTASAVGAHVQPVTVVLDALYYDRQICSLVGLLITDRSAFVELMAVAIEDACVGH